MYMFHASVSNASTRIELTLHVYIINSNFITKRFLTLTNFYKCSLTFSNKFVFISTKFIFIYIWD